MTASTALAPMSSTATLRACRGEDDADLQRRLEAFLLIAQRVRPHAGR